MSRRSGANREESPMSTAKSAVHWFEIFAADFERAVRFYQTTLGVDLRREPQGPKPMALFPYERGSGVGGSLVADADRAGTGGTLVYLDADGKLDACLKRAVEAGGAVVLPRTDIGDPGFIAVIRDSEGNVVGLHS